mmetsp:Transcript_57145/g.77929  ORF Transcript_57145/g.77929 Transcript_57145/m.77929 type:complete len:162 (-) Transcript_57145:148-633(-)
MRCKIYNDFAKEALQMLRIRILRQLHIYKVHLFLFPCIYFFPIDSGTFCGSRFPLEAYDMRPVRVCNPCLWDKTREYSSNQGCGLVKIGCFLCCWSQCISTSRAKKWVSEEKVVKLVKKTSSKFGPLWTHIKFKFLLKKDESKEKQPQTEVKDSKNPLTTP